MIQDATIEILCDGAVCQRTLTVNLPFIAIRGVATEAGETVDEYIRRRAEDESWRVVGEDVHLCPECSIDDN